MKSSLQHKDRHKHKIIDQALAKSRTKQRKILVVLSLQEPEEISCFVFGLILSLCLCCSCEPTLMLCFKRQHLSEFTASDTCVLTNCAAEITVCSEDNIIYHGIQHSTAVKSHLVFLPVSFQVAAFKSRFPIENQSKSFTQSALCC